MLDLLRYKWKKTFMALALFVREIYRHQGAKWGSHAYKDFFNTLRDGALGLVSFGREVLGVSDEGNAFFLWGFYKTLNF
jgi:hypothetical protein